MKPTRKPDGSTGYECEAGHVHEFMMQANVCDATCGATDGLYHPSVMNGVLVKDESKKLRVFREIPQPGELVVSFDNGGGPANTTGWRHFLDGRPADLGTTLRLVRSKESTFKTYRVLVRLDGPPLIRPGSPVILVFTNGEERFANREDRFEWPDTEPRKAAVASGIKR